ncbi:hypothetical protein PM082_008464 [Marasmius tenuissimus]|nr:hypothetical protein PM082_008464 [Marasmius tenuissimus]
MLQRRLRGALFQPLQLVVSGSLRAAAHGQTPEASITSISPVRSQIPSKVE